MARKPRCFECAGTGAACPDCWLCEGHMSVHWRRAVNQGWAKGDLDLDGSDYATCPRDECRGDTCDVCGGDGVVERGQFQIEVTRVLVFGLTQRLPPVIERFSYPDPRTFARAYAALDAPGRFDYANSRPRIIDRGRLLSGHAASYCMEKRWGNRLNSMLGHEFYLTPKGNAEAARRYEHWLNWLAGTSLKHWLDWMGADEPRRYYGPEPIDVAGVGRWADDGGAHGLA